MRVHDVLGDGEDASPYQEEVRILPTWWCRNAEIFADFLCEKCFYFAMARDCAHELIRRIQKYRVFCTFPYESAPAPTQMLNKIRTLHDARLGQIVLEQLNLRENVRAS